MSKRKNIKKSTRPNLLGIFVSITFVAFVIITIFKFTSNDNLSLSSDQVWCANCQTYHDRETAEQEKEKEKLVWCINCQRYHAPDADES
tara:strand:+ start:2121 stop:2387 length:267 start_codon:yes stop_codon:yes gene_type:complete